jgi:hypothetical protein
VLKHCRTHQCPVRGGGVTEQPKSKLMARLRARRRREGWVRVEVWVPAKKVAALRAYVRRLTKADSGDEVK